MPIIVRARVAQWVR